MVSIEWWVYPAVLAGLVVVSWLLHVLVKHFAPAGSGGKAHGMAALFIGEDGRASTSKLQAMLWTYAVLWAVISLLAGDGVDAVSEALGGDLREEYMLLLGGPYAAAIAAKAITASQVDKNPEVKPPKEPQPDRRTTLAERIAEVISNDEGGVDLGDFQYFAFTLLTLTFFAWAFIETPAEGLPAIPGTLLVLVGVSQATYVGKKGLLPPSAPATAQPAAPADSK